MYNEKGYIMDISSIQDLLEKIDGIELCRVIGNENEIEEIHILSDGSKSPKQISRDIQTVLVTKFDIKIDYKIISVVQFKGAESRIISRINFSGVSVTSSGNEIDAEVKLMYDDVEYASRQRGVNTVSNRYRMISEATLKSVEEIIGQPNILCTNDILVNNINGCTVVTVLVAARVNFAEETLAGAAVARDDMNETIVYAALDAVNKRVKSIKL